MNTVTTTRETNKAETSIMRDASKGCAHLDNDRQPTEKSEPSSCMCCPGPRSRTARGEANPAVIQLYSVFVVGGNRSRKGWLQVAYRRCPGGRQGTPAQCCHGFVGR